MSFPHPRVYDIPSHDLLTSMQNWKWNGADLVANQKTVGYSHNCHTVIAQVHSEWPANHYCNWKGPERPLSMSFLPLLACVVPSSTLNASQEREGFLICQVDFSVSCNGNGWCLHHVPSYHLVMVGNQKQWYYYAYVFWGASRGSLTNQW